MNFDSKENTKDFCVPTDDVDALFVAACEDGVAEVNLYAHDGMFKGQEDDIGVPGNCKPSQDKRKKVAYFFKIPCNDCTAAPSASPTGSDQPANRKPNRFANSFSNGSANRNPVLGSELLDRKLLEFAC